MPTQDVKFSEKGYYHIPIINIANVLWTQIRFILLQVLNICYYF